FNGHPVAGRWQRPRRAGSPAWRRRDDVDDPIGSGLQGTQERRQHRGGRGLGVMEQYDAAVGLVEPAEHEPELLIGRHPVPVARPQIGAEYDDAARGKLVEQGGRRGKSRKTEEWRGPWLAAL